MDQDIQQTLLAQLRDIHLPAEVSWWPLAIGWWIILFIFLTAGIFAIWALFRSHKKNRYRRLAIAELDSAWSQWQESQDAAAFVQSANAILKRTLAEASAHNNTYAQLNLTGENWVQLLNEHIKQPLSDNSAQALARAGYQPDPVVDVPELYSAVKRWVETHRIQSGTSLKQQGESIHV
jgi:hypothetical protein